MTEPWPSNVTASLIQHNCQPVGVYNGDLVYGSMNRDGWWDVYREGKSIDAIGYEFVQSHRGASDLQNGRLLMTVARSEMPMSAPGQGANNDLILFDFNTGVVTPLVTGRKGLFWARWHPTQDRICWAQQVGNVAAGELFGTQEIHAANVTPTGIADEIVVVAADGFNECYGWTRDGTRILMCSDQGAGWLKTTPYTVSDASTSTPVPLTAVTDYHEFLYVPPVGMFNDGIDSLLMGWCNETLGLELWRLLQDGSGTTKRLTYFNPSVGLGIGQLCFDPSNPKRIMLGLKVTETGKIDGWQLLLP